MSERKLDELLCALRSGLAVEPSPEFYSRVRAAEAGRQVASHRLGLALVGACATLVAVWALYPRPTHEIPELKMQPAQLVPAGQSIALASLALPHPPARSKAVGSQMPPGIVAAEPAPDALNGSPGSAGPAMADPPQFALADFEPVALPPLSTWTVEPAPMKVTVAEPAARPFPVVEFPDIEFTRVDLPATGANPGPVRVQLSKEKP